MKSASFKALFIILFCLLISVIVLYPRQIQAALHLTERYVSVEDPNSALLKLLLAPADFPGQFDWYWQRTMQSDQRANSWLSGYYNFHEVTIYQQVSQSDYTPVRDIDGGVHFRGDLAALDGVYDLQAAGIADFHGTQCAFNLDDTISCKVRIDRSEITMKMSIDYGEPGNVAAMQKVLNIVAALVEGKLKQ